MLQSGIFPEFIISSCTFHHDTETLYIAVFLQGAGWIWVSSSVERRLMSLRITLLLAVK